MYASVSCSFPTFPVCICVLPLPSCEFTFCSPPRDRTFLCRCPSFCISWVAILLCNFAVCVLFLLKYFFPVFPFYNVSFSFPISDEGTSCVVYLLVDRFVSNWFWNRWSPSLCGNVLRQRSRDFTQKANGICFLFLNCFFFSSLFTSPSHMCLFYAEAFFHPFHFAKLSSWRFFSGSLFLPTAFILTCLRVHAGS